MNEQLTDKAISYLTLQHQAAPDKPFFLYLAPAATHAPHQVSHEWSDLYKGKFDAGWDVFREQVFANQKKLGIIPPDGQLPARNPDVKAFNSLSPEEKKLYARFMEVYAGYLTYTDHQIGRLITYLKESHQLDHTLIFVMIGDNGASKEGTRYGVINRNNIRKNNKSDLFFGQGGPGGTKNVTAPESAADQQAYLATNIEDVGQIGTPEAQANYPLGWAQAANTPFKYWKSDAYAEGATRNPLIIFYPGVVTDKGGIRNQYSHLIDILPTTLEMAGAVTPSTIKGISQDTLQGVSLSYTLNDAAAPSRHTEQYYYILGSRSVYKDGWKAEALHHPDFTDLNNFAVGDPSADKDYEKDHWELYDLTRDFNERIDLAGKYPEKLEALKAQFDADAKKYNIYPFIDWDDVFHQRLHHTPNTDK